MAIMWYPDQKAKLNRDVRVALEQTATAVVTDLVQSTTLPRDTGALQESVSADRSTSAQGKVSVVTNTPYARRLYFHPEYQFRRDKNPKAGGEWYKPYFKGGNRHDWVQDTFAKLLRMRRG